MAKLMLKRVAATTIIEVLVAMVIIMTVFTIAMRIFINIMSSSVSFKKIQAQQQLQLLAKETQEQGFIANASFLKDSINYQYERDTSALVGYAKLKIKAYQGGKLLGTINYYYQTKEINVED